MRVSETVESPSDYGGMEPDMLHNATVADQYLSKQKENFIFICIYINGQKMKYPDLNSVNISGYLICSDPLYTYIY